MPLTTAAAHSATAVFHLPATRKPPALSFLLTTQFPPKRTKIKIYPQTKIFNSSPKTLSNPQTLELNSTNPKIPAGGDVKVPAPIVEQLVSESFSQSNSPADVSSEGLSELELIEKETKEFVPVEPKLSRFDIYGYLNKKIEEAEESEYSYWQSVGTPQTGNEFAGNKFSTPTIIQVGLSLVAAIVLDLVWSMSMARKLNAMSKEKKGELDNDVRKNSTIWERWAERKRKRNEVKNEGDVAIDESNVDKENVETRELVKVAKEEGNLGSKGNEVKNEGDLAIDESIVDEKNVENT